MDDWDASIHEEAALLLRSWVDALRNTSTGEALSCAEAQMTRLLVDRRLNEEQAREVLMHLASCRSCRALEMELQARRQLPPLRSFGLNALRAMATRDPTRVAPVVGVVSRWFERAVQPPVTPLSSAQAIIPLAFEEDQASKSRGGTTCTLLAPLAVDHRGRIGCHIGFHGPLLSEFCLDIVIGDEEQHLRLCTVPIIDQQVQCLVDGGILGLQPGLLAPGYLRLTAMPIKLMERRILPTMLPQLQALAQRQADPVTFWDGITDLIAVYADAWQEILRGEIVRIKKPSLAVAVVAYALEQASTYVRQWSAANNTEPAYSGEVIEGLTACLDLTQSFRRKAPDPETETTAFPRPIDIQNSQRAFGQSGDSSEDAT
jgi:hypothetical protein